MPFIMMGARARLVAAVAFALTLFSASGHAQSRSQLFQQGTEALYSLDFDRAEERYEQLTVIEPENPNNWNYLASAIWLKIMASQEKLNMESFSGAAIGTE